MPGAGDHGLPRHGGGAPSCRMGTLGIRRSRVASSAEGAALPAGTRRPPQAGDLPGTTAHLPEACSSHERLNQMRSMSANRLICSLYPAGCAEKHVWCGIRFVHRCTRQTSTRSIATQRKQMGPRPSQRRTCSRRQRALRTGRESERSPNWLGVVTGTRPGQGDGTRTERAAREDAHRGQAPVRELRRYGHAWVSVRRSGCADREEHVRRNCGAPYKDRTLSWRTMNLTGVIEVSVSTTAWTCGTRNEDEIAWHGSAAAPIGEPQGKELSL